MKDIKRDGKFFVVKNRVALKSLKSVPDDSFIIVGGTLVHVLFNKSGSDAIYSKVSNAKTHKAIIVAKWPFYIQQFLLDIEKENIKESKMKKSEVRIMIVEELTQLNEKRFPAKAMDYNKVKDPDRFWKWTIKQAKDSAGLSWGRQTDVGDLIMWLNMAATRWNDYDADKGKKR